MSLTVAEMLVPFMFAAWTRAPGSARRESPFSLTQRAGLLSIALVACAGCGGSGDSGIAANADSVATTSETPPPYQVADVARSGAIVGEVTLTSPAPADTMFAVGADYAELCGSTRSVALVEHRGEGELMENVVVWLADARSGKALPVERRYQITNSDCSLVPRVQAAVEGGMLNVRNADPSAHRTLFERGGDTIATIRESEAGQVVPTGKALARSGLVEVRSDRYPWSRAWIRVFDHPYFAVTNRDGTFTLDSVPPGHYRLMAWDARLGVREREVSVQAARDSRADLSF